MSEQGIKDMDTESYTKMTADVYDALYSWKDYETEAETIKGFIARFKQTDGNELLDVACGTGLHLPFLADDFEITGVDLSQGQVDEAKKRLPQLTFAQGDIRDFDMHHQYDVVTCLFSSIGYVYPQLELEKAVVNMANHLKPGGVLFIEPWLTKETYNPNKKTHVLVGEKPEKSLKVTRTTSHGVDGDQTVMTMHHLVERQEGTDEFTEEHRLALYSRDDFQKVFEAAGLPMDYDEHGISGRGLYIGCKPALA